MPKKTCQLIIDSGNDYGVRVGFLAKEAFTPHLIAVKGNQPQLYQQIQLNTKLATPTSIDTSVEKTRDRMTLRTVSVFDDLSQICADWSGLKALIKVERRGWRGNRHYHQLAYYISSFITKAEVFQQGIRGHWSIENRLHWTKDVVFQEDNSSIRAGNAPVNLSIIRSIVINILRLKGFSSLTVAQRLMGNNLSRILPLLLSVRE